MWCKIQKFFMIVILVASIILEIFLFQWYQSLKKINPDIEIQSFKFISYMVAALAAFFFMTCSFLHVIDLFRLQARTEKDLFAYDKQFQLRNHGIELQTKLKEKELQTKLKELQNQLAEIAELEAPKKGKKDDSKKN